MAEATQTPLTDLLRGVPKDAVYRWEPGPYWSAQSPIGLLMHAAASRIEELEAAMGDIAEGLVPPIPHGHYLAHRHAVNVARVALRQALSDKG